MLKFDQANGRLVTIRVLGLTKSVLGNAYCLVGVLGIGIDLFNTLTRLT